jgi:hypothetical protein
MLQAGLGRIILPAVCALLVMLANSPARAAQRFYASPSGSGTLCTQAQPCLPQEAVLACHAQTAEVCFVSLADGVYLNPAIDIAYYRRVDLIGNCNQPQNVVLRATHAGTNIIAIQDHATGIIRCLTLDATETATGVGGIVTRQHVIADYDTIIFGPMPSGTHVALTEFSIATCGRQVYLSGDAAVHAMAANMSKLNLLCQITMTAPRAFSYFVNSTEYSVIDGHATTIIGTATGTACNLWNAIVYKPMQGFPGSQQGNC